jgi:uncharacterized membrane protein YhaH (DUF805 family)
MKWFIKCFKQYADFSGRARRKEFWWFNLINFIIMMILIAGWIWPVFSAGIEAGIEGADAPDIEALTLMLLKSPFLYIYIIYYLAILIPNIAVSVRRLHDIGKSGFWYFLPVGGSVLTMFANLASQSNMVLYIVLALIALAISIVFLVWMFMDSKYGPNQYGLNPKGEGNPKNE